MLNLEILLVHPFSIFSAFLSLLAWAAYPPIQTLYRKFNFARGFPRYYVQICKKTSFTHYNCLIFVGYPGSAKFRNANYFCKLERRGYLRRGRPPGTGGFAGGGIVGRGSELGGLGGWGGVGGLSDADSIEFDSRHPLNELV